MNDDQEKLLFLMDEDVVNDLHNKGRQYIDRFSNIKMRYKKLALSWATAYLLGLFYICVYEQQVLHINRYNIIAFLTMFTIIGIKLIQFLDINIGHGQLRSIFKYLLLYEKKETSLIKPYTKIEQVLYNRNFDPVFIDFSFYLSINFGIAVLGILALVLKMKSEFLSSMIISVGFITIFLAWQIITLLYLIHSRHKKISDSDRTP